MLDTFKPYPKYKDSGLPWLGDIPSHWEVRRNSRLFSQRNETGYPDLPILEVSLKTGVRVRNLDNSKRKQIMSDREKYKRAAKGDIAYNMMRMWQGAVGVAPVDGLVSPAYVVARPHQEVDSRYYSYLFRTDAYKNEVNKFSRGIVSDRNRLYWDEFKNIPSPHPPREEQTTISNFLDMESGRIRIFIDRKLKLIKLLKEQKNAIINLATTNGINHEIPFKKTEFALLGDIPQHWSVVKLKRIAKFNPSKSETSFSKHSNDNVVFLPMERISVDGQIDCSESRKVSEVWDGFRYFRKHDVIVAKITPCFENGKGAYLGELETEYGFGTTELIVIRPTSVVEPRFLYLLVNTPVFRRECTEVMIGAAGQKRVPVEFVKNFAVGLPPLNEQIEILSYIDFESSKIDKAINRTQKEIELIKEYHSCMINDLVTGKLDVRSFVPADAFNDSDLEELTDTESVIDEDLIDEEE